MYPAPESPFPVSVVVGASSINAQIIMLESLVVCFLHTCGEFAQNLLTYFGVCGILLAHVCIKPLLRAIPGVKISSAGYYCTDVAKTGRRQAYPRC